MANGFMEKSNVGVSPIIFSKGVFLTSTEVKFLEFVNSKCILIWFSMIVGEDNCCSGSYGYFFYLAKVEIVGIWLSIIYVYIYIYI